MAEAGAPRRPAVFVPAAGDGLRKALAAALGAKHGGAAWFALSALRRGGGPGDAARAYRAQLAWERGDSARAEAAWRGLAGRSPGNPDWPLWLSNAAATRGEFAAAERILVEARERGAAGPALEMTIEHYGRWLRRSNIAPAEAEALVNDPGAPPYRLLHAAIFLSTEGRLDLARQGLARVAGHPRHGRQARTELAALDALERGGLQASLPGTLSPARPHVLVRRPGSDTLVIVFMPPAGGFGGTANAIQAMLGTNPPHALYLYDSKALYHLAGTDRFGDGYSAMVDGLRRLGGELGVRRVVTLGPSAAGFTAIRVGLDIGADAVVAAGAVTSMTAEAMHADGRMPGTRSRLLESVPEQARDLKPDLVARAGRPRVHLFYGDSNREDGMHAHHLSGVPGVTLHPIADLGMHDPFGELLLRGETGALEPLLAGD
ncbi:MAG: hypothetical protein QOG84_2730 [Sphingomonadales bacterium]|jgi:hypothetical protein|nr:hypothetical protein [Sphingomonadales bacterium]